MKDKRKKYTNEDLLEYILTLSKELNKTPRLVDMGNKKGFPSPKVYQKRFGSWNNALSLSGLELNSNFNFTKDSIKTEVISFYNKNNRSPFYNEVSFSNTVWKRLWDTWNDLLIECKLPLNKKYHNLKTKEDGIHYLKELSKRINRIPKAKDVDADGVNRNWFTKEFGSWKHALFYADFINEKELNNSYEAMAVNNITYLLKLSGNLSRVPMLEEYEEFLTSQKDGTYLSRRNLCNRLNKTYTEICEEHLSEELLENHTKHYRNKDNKLCKSIAELNISNLLIDNEIELKYEPSYSEIAEIKYKYRFDWCVDDVYIEYFGLFQENTYGNKVLDDYKQKTYIKIGICKFFNIKLIALFPNDVRNNFKGLIDKLESHNIKLSHNEKIKV